MQISITKANVLVEGWAFFFLASVDTKCRKVGLGLILVACKELDLSFMIVHKVKV